MSKTKVLSRYILTFLSLFIMFALLTSTKLYYLSLLTVSLFGDVTVNNTDSFSLAYSIFFAVLMYYFLGKRFDADKGVNRKTLIKNSIAVVLIFAITAANM